MSIWSYFANDNNKALSGTGAGGSCYDFIDVDQDIAVLDIGSYNVACIIASLDRNNNFKVKGYAKQATRGVKSGTIIDMDALISSISATLHDVESMARVTVTKIFINLPPQLSRSDEIEVSLQLGGGAVTKDHIKKMIVQACSADRFVDREIVHAISHSYELDTFKGIIEPINMVGDQLNSKVLVISVDVQKIRNLIAAIVKSHLEVEDFIDSAFASGLGVLVKDEMELGTIVIDMGASTTSFSIFNNGNLIRTGHIKLGANQITRDIAKGLNTPLVHAERIKNLYGSAISGLQDDKEQITVPVIGVAQAMVNQKIPKSTVTQIIRPRVEEILQLLKKELESLGIKGLRSFNIVITGGGSELSGIEEVARLIFGRHVRIGFPLHLIGFDRDKVVGVSEYAVAAGMLEYIKLQILESRENKNKKRKKNKIFAKLGLWLEENL